jgi:hypothetical protein
LSEQAVQVGGVEFPTGLPELHPEEAHRPDALAAVPIHAA